MSEQKETKIEQLLSTLDNLFSIEEIQSTESINWFWFLSREKYPIQLPENIKFNRQLTIPFNLTEEMKNNQFKLLLSILMAKPCNNQIFTKLCKKEDILDNENYNWLAYYISQLLFRGRLVTIDYILLYRLLGCSIHTEQTKYLQIVNIFTSYETTNRVKLRENVIKSLNGNYFFFQENERKYKNYNDIKDFLTSSGIPPVVCQDISKRIVRNYDNMTLNDFLYVGSVDD